MWRYEDEPVNGGAGGEVFRSIFNGSGLDAASRLAREAIQNSVDAARPDTNPDVALCIKAYKGADLDRIWREAGLNDLAERVGVLGLHEGNALRRKPEVLRVLHVVDSGTTGLSGDPTSPGSKLRKLLMEIGGSQKLTDGASGGSYGFGKAVYSSSSRVAVVFAYSRTIDQNGVPLSVLMGCAYHKAHEFQGRRTSGRAFFGHEQLLERATRYDAFTGGDADRRAVALDMARAEHDQGTTIAIFDCPLEMENIRRGVEHAWWPKIERDNFRVHLIDEHGTRHHARPKQVPELKPFIDALAVVQAISPEQPGKFRRKTNFNRVNGKNLGQLGLVVMPEPGEIDEDADCLDLRDSIALVRSPGMVVQYFDKRQVNHPPVAGVFLADNEIDDILRRSEPPEHDRWDAKADRLEPAHGEHEIVEAVHKRIWSELRTFQRSARPPEPATGNPFLRQLERDLAKLFGATGKHGPVGDGKGETPISLKSEVRIVPEKSGLKLTGRVSIQLKAEHEGELPVVVALRLDTVDEGGHRVDPLALAVEFIGVQAHERVPGEWTLSLVPGKKVDIQVESVAYDADWTVEFVPSVRPFDGEDAR